MVIAIITGLQGVASAALPAPNWLPGQPLLAGTQVIAMWLPVPGAVKYIVYLDGKKVAESPANQYMGVAPTEGGIHKFEVAAVDAAGAEGPKSAPGQITIIVLEPPQGMMVRPNPGAKAIGVRWVPSKGAVISNVYRADKKDGPYNLLESIQGTDNYKDTGVEYGKEYWYAVTAKDVTGKESGRSEAVNVTMKEPEERKAAEQVKIDLVVVPSVEADALRFLGSVPVAEINDIDMDDDTGELWVTNGEKGQVIVLTPDFERRLTINLKSFNADNGLSLKNATYVTVSEESQMAVVTDNFSSTAVALDLDGKLLWSFKPQKPPEDRDDIWQFLKEKTKTVRLIPNQVLFLADGRLLISEARAPLVYVVDPDSGEIEDWFSGYTRGEEKIQSGGIAAFIQVAPDLVWAGEPLLKRVVAFDPDTYEVKYILGEDGKHDGFIAGFLGVNAFLKNPRDNTVLVADAGIGAVQAFDPATAEYKYHIGGDPPAPDADFDNQRPLLDVGAINEIFFMDDGTMWMKHGLQKYFSVRNVNWDGVKTFPKGE
jgi:fibronectin type 3 domain-containing protein